MATKARVLKLAISKDDSIDVAIWKLMADRKGRTASDIADALVEYGHNRVDTTTRAKALMRRGWFIRDEKQGKAIAKYILKGNIEMPKQDNDKTQTEPGFMPTADELSNAPVIENRDPSLNNILGDTHSYNKAPEEILNTPVPGEDVIAAPQAVVDALDEIVQANVINPAEGVLTCIWKITHDFHPYTKEDVVVLLTAAGIGESTAKQKFAEAILKGWFIAHTQKILDKEVKVYRLQDHIEKPVDDKPYKARGPYNKAPEVKQPDLVDQAQQPSTELQEVRAKLGERAKEMFGVPAGPNIVVTDAGLEKANEILGGTLSSIPQASGVPGPDRSQGESELSLPTDRYELKPEMVTDLKLALFTWVATWPLDTKEGIISELVKQHFKLEDVEEAFAANEMYFIAQPSASDSTTCYKLPHSMTRQTVTKERIANYVNEFHREKREEFLDRSTTPTINKEEEMAKTPEATAATKPAPKKRLTKAEQAALAAQQAYDNATVVLWNLVLKNRNNEEQNVIDNFASAIADEELRKRVWDDNSRYFDITMVAEVNYIKSPFDLEMLELTLDQINKYKEAFDAMNTPIDPELLASVTPYDGSVRAVYLLLKDGKSHRRHDLVVALRGLGYTGPMIEQSINHAIRNQNVILSGDGLHLWQAQNAVESPPAYKIVDGLDPMDGLDYCIYEIIKDGEPRFMSDIINKLTATGISEARARDRLMQLSGVQYNFLEIQTTDEGMKFLFAPGGTVPQKKEVIKPNEEIPRLQSSDGFLWNLWKVLNIKGRANFDALAHMFAPTGMNRELFFQLLEDVVKDDFLVERIDTGFKLKEGAEEPKKPINWQTLDRKDGLDYVIFKLLEDGNWTTKEYLVDLLAHLGFNKERAHDRVVKLMDKDGWIIVGKIGDYDVVRVDETVPEPAKEVQPTEERRATPEPAPSGLHAYEKTSGTPEPKAAPAKPLMSINIDIAGIPLSIGGAIQLYMELTTLGYGQQGYMPQNMRQRILQSQHTINGKVMTDGELQQIAMVLGQQIPPGLMAAMAQPQPQPQGYGGGYGQGQDIQQQEMYGYGGGRPKY